MMMKAVDDSRAAMMMMSRGDCVDVMILIAVGSSNADASNIFASYQLHKLQVVVNFVLPVILFLSQ